MRTVKPIRPLDFFAAHPVFTHAEFVAAHTAGGRSPNTSNALLAKHVRTGRLLRVRRGLYVTVPPGRGPDETSVDPYPVATKLADDAVVAFHAALMFHGKAYSSWHRYTYLTADRLHPSLFRGLEFVAVQAPVSVRSMPEFGGGVLLRPHAGGEVRVMSLERCLVDLLHAPERGGGWEEIWRSLEMVESFDLDAVVEYTNLYRSALTAARVGFFLEQHREEWMVEENHLGALRRMAPRQPCYLSPRREPGKLVARWNLIVPPYVLWREWEEPS